MGEKLFDRKRTSNWLPYLVVLFCGVGLAIALIQIDAFERLYRFTRTRESWELDEFLVAGFSTLVALVAMAVIRVTREVRQRQHEETRMHNLLRHEPTTGLPNRIYLEEELLRRTSYARRLGTQFAVAILHVDGIEQITSLHGHQSVDEVMRTLATRLRSAPQAVDCIARLTGNEFAFIIAPGDGLDELSAIVAGIADLVRSPVKLDTSNATFTASLGIAIYPIDATARDKLLQCASLASQQSREVGGNETTFYNPKLEEAQRQQAQLKTDISEAVQDHQFLPFFQPLVSLSNGRLTGFEVLARWRHPERGLLPPRDFISAAEETGLISEIFWDLIRQVCEAARNWPDTISVSVNVSPVQLADGHFSQTLLTALRAESFAPERLAIEITENTVVGDIAAVRSAMEQLKRHGIRFSLDDFGRGYSSLHYLGQLPFDTIKIDKSFIQSFHRENGSYQIVSSIIKLCRSLGLKTTGEGIETLDEANELQELGCTYGQGFLFSKPVFPAVATRIVEQSIGHKTAGRPQGDTAASATLFPTWRFE